MKFIDKLMRELGYIPIPKKGTIRVCQECGKQVKRGHRWYMWQGLPMHYSCQMPNSAPIDLRAPQKSKMDLQQLELSLTDDSIMNAVE